MIECEFKCLKGEGKAATTEIFFKPLDLLLYVCDPCLDSFETEDIDILDTEVN